MTLARETSPCGRSVICCMAASFKTDDARTHRYLSPPRRNVRPAPPASSELPPPPEGGGPPPGLRRVTARKPLSAGARGEGGPSGQTVRVLRRIKVPIFSFRTARPWRTHVASTPHGPRRCRRWTEGNLDNRAPGLFFCQLLSSTFVAVAKRKNPCVLTPSNTKVFVRVVLFHHLRTE